MNWVSIFNMDFAKENNSRKTKQKTKKCCAENGVGVKFKLESANNRKLDNQTAEKGSGSCAHRHIVAEHDM